MKDRSNQHIASNQPSRKEIAAKEGGWQKFIRKRHQTRNDEFIPDPAAAPIGTDQEAGGAITTPEGHRKYD